MARELRAATVDPAAPAPSVEAILHALIPHRFVDHTHADAVIALTNTPSGPRHAHEAFGEAALLVPYVMPGFDLARRCPRARRRSSTASGPTGWCSPATVSSPSARPRGNRTSG